MITRRTLIKSFSDFVYGVTTVADFKNFLLKEEQESYVEFGEKNINK